MKTSSYGLAKYSNIEIALTGYQVVSNVYTPEAFPQQWANTQNNLGNAYIERIEGDKTENREQAIQYYQQALTVYTPEAYPVNWAWTQDHLGTAYIQRIRGDKAENLEHTIYYCQQALTVYTPEAFPQQWATTQNNLAAAYSDRIRGDKAENRELAIHYYQQALTVFTPEAFPYDCLRINRNLGHLYFTEGDYQLAVEPYSQAIAAVELVRSWSLNDQRRQEIIKEAIDIYQNIVQSYVNLGQIEKAIEYVDRSRAKQLVDLMASHDLYQDATIPENVQKYLQDYQQKEEELTKLRSLYQSQQGQNISSPDSRQTRNFQIDQETIISLENEKQQLWQEIRSSDPVLAGQIQVDPLSFDQMQALIDSPTTALLSFYSTNKDTYIFILYQNKAPQIQICEGEGIENLQNWALNNWLIPYLDDRSQWRNNLQTFLCELSERLHLNDLIDQHLEGIEELIIIPHLLLHQIPFAALPLSTTPISNPDPTTEDQPNCENSRGLVFSITPDEEAKPTPYYMGETLGDRFRLRFIASCRILSYCHERPNTLSFTNLGIVEDASSDLIFTRYECQSIAQLYQVPSQMRLQREQATVENYYSLLNQIQGLHSSHHASFNPLNPLQSCLVLADRTLTLGELMTPSWRLPDLLDVFISCCETHLTSPEITDNLLTLATGFLFAGARSVTSTLWAVDDFASALLALFYYEERSSGSSRPQALQSAQKKLRQLTGNKLETQYKASLVKHLIQQLAYQLTGQELQLQYKPNLDQHLKELVQKAKERLQQVPSPEKRKKFRAIITRIYLQHLNLIAHCKQENPFASAYYWSGFISQGMA